jgi:hypothetical protein
LPIKLEQTECSETSIYKIQTPGNYPEENIQHAEHDEILKSRSNVVVIVRGYKEMRRDVCELDEVKTD